MKNNVVLHAVTPMVDSLVSTGGSLPSQQSVSALGTHPLEKAVWDARQYLWECTKDLEIAATTGYFSDPEYRIRHMAYENAIDCYTHAVKDAVKAGLDV